MADQINVRWPADLLVKPLVPREEPLQSPLPVGIFDAPYVCLKVNRQWWSHVIGVLDVLTQPDAWTGSEEDVQLAIEEIEALMASAEEACEEMPTEYVRTINFCTEGGQIEVVKVVDGVEVIEYGSPAACMSYVENIIGCTDGTIEYTQVSDGLIETLEIDLNACGIVGIQGEQGETGPQGIQGIQGEQGIPGEPGVCEEPCDTDNAPVDIASESFACGIATYIINWHDDRYDDFLNEVDVGVSVLGIVDGFIGAIPGVGIIAESLVGAATAAFGTAVSVLRADVSSTDIEDWRCSLFCDIQANAIYGAEQLRAWIAEERALATQLGEQVWLDSFAGYTDDEMNKRLAVGNGTANTECDSLCDCAVETCESDLTDWTAVPRNFTLGGPCTGSFDGTKFVGCCPGPNNTGEAIRIEREWAGTITKITVTVDGLRTRGSSTAGFFIQIEGVTVYQPAVDSGVHTLVYEPASPVTGGTVNIEHAFGSNNCADSAFVHITAVEICGVLDA
jgi:hypothetical protein